MSNYPDQPHCRKKHLSHLNLDFTKNLNDQGYYGPFPNDADPRPIWNGTEPCNDSEKEYREWVENWIVSHNGVFDNHRMYLDRREVVHARIIAERRAHGDMSTLIIEYW